MFVSTVSACGHSSTLDASGGGSIGSPNYPRNYDNNHRCYWYIQSNPGTAILIQVRQFHLETCCDYLQVMTSQTTSFVIFFSEYSNRHTCSIRPCYGCRGIWIFESVIERDNSINLISNDTYQWWHAMHILYPLTIVEYSKATVRHCKSIAS